MRSTHLFELINLPTEMQSRTLRIVEYVVSNEHTLNLIRKRHVDLILLCALKCNVASRLDMERIMDGYSRQPQYLKSTIYEIKGLTEGSQISFDAFWAGLFMTKVKSFMETRGYTVQLSGRCSGDATPTDGGRVNFI